MLIGLTGKYCAGKNIVATVLEKSGFLILDLDKLGHIAIESKKTEIYTRFGENIKKPDGTIDRHKLGKKVFGRKPEMTVLENIIHPEVNSLTNEWITRHQKENCVLNAALLHKSDVFERLDCIILVKAPFFTRLLRAKKRDKLSFFDIIKRFWIQKYFYAKYSAENADIYKVRNPGIGISKLVIQINSIQQKL